MSEVNLAFCSWSGGKDCCLALDRYLRNHPNTKVYLLSMLKSDLGRTYGHFVHEEMLRSQATAMGVEIVFGYSGMSDYEEKWRVELGRLKERGVTTGIFGDIDLEAHRVWINRVMTDVELEMEMPLWEEDRRAVVDEFIARDYRGTIISVNNDMCDPSYLGRSIDEACVRSLIADGVDPSAEGGEFHSFTVSGPLFSGSVAIKWDGTITDHGHTYLNLS